jgi:hypothetical protein
MSKRTKKVGISGKVRSPKSPLIVSPVPFCATADAAKTVWHKVRGPTFPSCRSDSPAMRSPFPPRYPIDCWSEALSREGTAGLGVAARAEQGARSLGGIWAVPLQRLGGKGRGCLRMKHSNCKAQSPGWNGLKEPKSGSWPVALPAFRWCRAGRDPRYPNTMRLRALEIDRGHLGEGEEASL